jgi:hypothetical protein
MLQSQEKGPPRYPRRIAAEDRAWRRLYRSAGNPVAASEMLEHLQSDDDATRIHLALVLRCRETLRRQALRRARIEWIGRIAGGVFKAAVVGPWKAVRRVLAARRAATGGETAQVPSRQSFAAIESAAPRASVVQLRADIARVSADRPALDPDDRQHADALLLKLERLLRDQLVDPAPTESATHLPSMRSPALPHAGPREHTRDAA